MTSKRIENAKQIIKNAIKNGTYVSKESVEFGFSETYVKNVKADLTKLYNEEQISDGIYHDFMTLYAKYMESVRMYESEDELPNVLPEEEGMEDKPSVPLSKTGIEQFDKGNQKTLIYKEITGGKEEQTEADPEIEDEEERGANWWGQYPTNHVKTPEELVERVNLDTDIWDWKVGRLNKWDVSGIIDNQFVTWENFQVRLDLFKRQDVAEVKTAMEILDDLLKRFKPSKLDLPVIGKQNVVNESDTKKLLEIALFDLHLGKLAWAGETGENFDTKIARERFLGMLTDILGKARGFDYHEILFPIGNDFFNSDNLHNTTTAGTPQDEDLRWQKTFDAGVELIVDAIYILKQTGLPVNVMVVPGNHDFERSYYLGKVVNAWFKDDEQVKLDCSADPRKYFEWGEVLLGFTHGKYEKEQSLPMIMAHEQKKAWGRTSFHEWHLGHFHKKTIKKLRAVFDKSTYLDEEVGVTIRYLSSLTGTEQWHHKRGFIGSHKAGEAFIWDEKSGYECHFNANWTEFDREH